MKRHAAHSGEPHLLSMSPIASSSLRDEPAPEHGATGPTAGPPAAEPPAALPPPPPEEEGESQEKRRRALRFRVPGETPRQPRGWLEQLSYAEETTDDVGRFPFQARQDDIDQLLHTGPRFSDLIRPGWSDVPERQPEIAEEHYRGLRESGEAGASAASAGSGSNGGGSGAALTEEPQPVAVSSVIPGKGIGRFDEAEIENRRRIHYRAHQPLKSLEPKVLRKLKERIEQGRTQAVMAREAGVQKPLPATVEGGSQDADDEDSRGKRTGHGRRRRRRRRRHRSKKAEPFQPTLGHVSEEQQSMSPEDDDDEEDASSFDPDGGQDTLDELDEEFEEDERRKDRRPSSPGLLIVVDQPDSSATPEPDVAPALSAAVPPPSGSPIPASEAVTADAGEAEAGGVSALEAVPFAEGAARTPEGPRKSAATAGGQSELRRPSFHLGWDSNRNSEANLQSMNHHHPSDRSRSASDACSPDTCCTQDPATCPEPPCQPETCPDNQADAKERSSRHRNHHHHHHHHHHGHREHFSKKDLRERCFSGAELRQLSMTERSNSQVPTEAEEASGLKAKDLEEMNAHRLERYKVKHHRHKPSVHRLPNSIVSVVEVDHMEPGLGEGETATGHNLAGSPSTAAFRSGRGVDHRPHDLFVELDELTFKEQDRMWQWSEKARWIRFEEDLVEGGERWGKAHVASLSFHSLLQMRNLLESATFIKDLEANDLPQIAGAIYDQLVHTHTLTEEEADSVRKMLLLKHSHVGHEHRGRPSSPQPNIDAADRNFTSPTQLHHGEERKLPKQPIRSPSAPSNAHLGGRYHVRSHGPSDSRLPDLDEKGEDFSGRSRARSFSSKITEGEAQMTAAKSKRSILDKLKPHIGGVADLLTTDCEVVSSLVGYSPHVSQTLTVVLRLAHGVWLPTFSEVDRPTRFIFLFLVPFPYTEQGCVDERDEYTPREIGRVFATLMADQDFHEIAYKAECREDLVSGLRDFLDKSIVLPPGEWDRATLLPVVKYQRERIAKQKRTQSMRSRQDTEPSMASAHFPASVGARLADMEESMPLMEAGVPSYSRKESSHSLGVMDNDQANIMAGAVAADKGYPPSYAIAGTKPSAGTRCRRLCRRCIPFAGLCNDLGRLRRRYVSDWTDPFKKGGIADVLVGSLFLLFVALAPAITFGALMEQLVNPQMSLSKSLVAAGLFQFLFTLIGGQPQIVLGVTGPVFIIETVIGMMAGAMGLDYVAFRFIVAVSASAWGFIFLIGNLASYISRVPRSVEEIFNMFTAIFYLFKSIVSMARPFLHPGHLNVIAMANTTHFSSNETMAATQAFQHFASANGTLLIAIGTYTLVMTLAKFKQSRAFTRRVRWFLGSFNVPTAILLMTIVANLLFRDYPLKSLDIPASAANPASWVTMPKLSLLENAGVPAFLLAALIGLCTHLLTFTETGICGLTLAKPETGMTKPTLFHLNILIVQTLLPLASGLMCWPFVTGAVVRSNAHVLALQVWEDRALPGVRRRLVGIREQRISGVMIGILVFLCVFLGPYVLRLIPMGAMYGMFLFMGVSTFRGLQMVTRTRLLLQRRRYWPETSYLQAPLRVLVAFTCIEWFIVILLFTLNCLTEFANLSYPSLFFPIILVVYGILRIHILPRWSLMKDHLNTIDKGHGVEVDPPHQTGRCCGRRGRGDDDAGSELGAASYHSGKSSRRMTPVASAAGGFDGIDGLVGGGGVTSAVYEQDSEESDVDTEADMYQNTDRL